MSRPLEQDSLSYLLRGIDPAAWARFTARARLEERTNAQLLRDFIRDYGGQKIPRYNHGGNASTVKALHRRAEREQDQRVQTALDKDDEF